MTKLKVGVLRTLSRKGIYLIRHKYFKSLKSQASPSAIDLLKRYKVEANSVLHIGAHYGEEADEYAAFGINRGVFIEGDPLVFPKLIENLERFENFFGIRAMLSNATSKAEFFRASNEGASSSILRPARHIQERPDILFEQPAFIATVPLDSLNLGVFELIVIDVQGAELNVINGGQKTIAKAKAIWVEVNSGEMYEGDSSPIEIIVALADNFIPIFMNMNENYWGDALLINRNHFKQSNLSELR
jgi:FkbM family methyltransferase